MAITHSRYIIVRQTAGGIPVPQKIIGDRTDRCRDADFVEEINTFDDAQACYAMLARLRKKLPDMNLDVLPATLSLEIHS